MAVLFITEQYLKDTTEINLNVDPKLIIPSILKAQDLHIQPVLGSTLYKELQTQIQTSAVTALNLTLLTEYVQKATAEWSYYKVLNKLTFKMMNKDIMRKNSENSTPVELKELIFLRDEQRNDAEAYTEKLKNYLEQNRTLFPSYNNPGTGLDVMQPTRQSYWSGMYLGNSSNNCRGLDYPGNNSYFNS